MGVGRALTSILLPLCERPGVRSVGIGETFRQALAKIVMRAAGDQAKTACGAVRRLRGRHRGCNTCRGTEEKGEVEGETERVVGETIRGGI